MVMDFTSNRYGYYDSTNLKRLKLKHENQIVPRPNQVDSSKRFLRCIEDGNLNKRRRLVLSGYDKYGITDCDESLRKSIDLGCRNCAPVTDYICDSENCGVLDESNKMKASMVGSRSQTVSIHETYELGYADNFGVSGPGSLYVFDFVDGVEVTYPVTIPSSEALPIDLPPLFTEPKYSNQLNPLASNALKQLAQRIENWLVSYRNTESRLIVWRHMNAHKLSCELRIHILRLLKILVPQFSHHKLDPESPTVDKFLSMVLKQFDADDFDVNSCIDLSENIDPVVVLNSDPDNCLQKLRFQVLTLVQKLMPHLVIPQDFDFEKDLIPLINVACTLNKAKM